MAGDDLETHGSIAGVLIGLSLILFRKQLRTVMFERANKKADEESLNKIRKTEGVLCKGIDAAIAVLGTMMIIMNSYGYFLDPQKYQRYFVGIFGLMLLALCPTCICELLLLRLIFRDANKYELNRTYEKNELATDAAFRILKKRANRLAGICFFSLYIVFVGLFYVIVKALVT